MKTTRNKIDNKVAFFIICFISSLGYAFALSCHSQNLGIHLVQPVSLEGVTWFHSWAVSFLRISNTIVGPLCEACSLHMNGEISA